MSRVPAPVLVLAVGVLVAALVYGTVTVFGSDYRLTSTGDDERIAGTTLDTSAVAGVTVTVRFEGVADLRAVEVTLPSGETRYLDPSTSNLEAGVELDVNEPGTIEFRYLHERGGVVGVDRIRLVESSRI
ncbi:MAG: hypothetical protein ABEJ88_01840 [Halobacterium sp.]